MSSSDGVVELIGVYHADGGVVGEVRYVVGHLLGRTHCSLCDITHSPVRRKRAWVRMAGRLGVPFRLLHLNELPPDVAATVRDNGSPLVLARRPSGHLDVVLDTVALDALHGSVDGFETALTTALAARRR